MVSAELTRLLENFAQEIFVINKQETHCHISDLIFQWLCVWFVIT